MSKPIIKTINTFDASVGTTIYFVWNGEMAYNNHLVIYDAETMDVTWEHTYPNTHTALNHVIESGVLINSTRYAASVAVIDVTGKESDFSDKVYFVVQENPTFYFNGLSTTEINQVESSTLATTLFYSQPDGTPISSYEFFLYTVKNNQPFEQVDQSGVLTNQYKLAYTYRSFENDRLYMLRATGVNTKGVEVDTGYVTIEVHYENPNVFSRIMAEADSATGVVKYSSNIVDIESDRPSEEYTFNDGFIDLTQVALTKTFAISESNPLYPDLTITWLGIDGEYHKGGAYESASYTVRDYLNVTEIDLEGEYKQLSYPVMSMNNYQPGDFTYVKSIDLTIGNTLIQDVTASYPLRKLPMHNICDELVIRSDGSRYIKKRVGEIVINGTSVHASNTHTSTDSITGHTSIVLEFEADATYNYGHYNLVCDTMPVQEHGSKVVLQSGDGWITFYWDYTEFNIRNMDQILAWLSEHPTRILYPLKEVEYIYLDKIELPDMTNTNSVSYSDGFTIPDNATFSIRITECFKTCKILKVGDAFMLESIVYDDGYLRYKLTAYGPSGNYIIYSDPLQFMNWDEDFVTVHIRKIGGLYDLYVFVESEDPDPKRDIWFTSSEPGLAQNTDLWIDIPYTQSHIGKDEVVRVYQSAEPSGLNNESIWIGD